MTKAAEVEYLADAIDVQVDTIEKISAIRMFFRSPKVIIGGTVLISAGAGFAAGYFLTKSQLEAKFSELLENEIAEAKAFYSQINKVQYPTPADAVAALVPEEETSEKPHVAVARREAAQAVVNYQGKFKKDEEPTDDEIAAAESMALAEQIDVVEETTETVTSVFDGTDPISDENFDYDAEVALRTDEAPYIITHDEYFEGTEDYSQQVLTYFQGDDVLVDDQDAVVDAVESTVGYDNLKKFGHGSKDGNIVYIRNDRMLVDVEVHKSTGSYSEEVLGVTQNALEHSHKPRVRKMRHNE